MEILEIQLKKLNLLLDLVKNYLVVRVRTSTIEHHCKKQLIQLTHLINITKDNLSLLSRDDALSEEGHPEVS